MKGALWLSILASNLAARVSARTWKLEPMPGFFVHESYEAFDPASPIEISANMPYNEQQKIPLFGLIDQDYSEMYPGFKPEFEQEDKFRDKDGKEKPKPWVRFRKLVEWLNKRDAGDARYKLIYLTRHGKAVHNEIIDKPPPSKRTLSEWKAKAHLEEYRDPDLTERGAKMSEETRDIFQEGVQRDKMPAPGACYSSQFKRALHTSDIIYKGLGRPGRKYEVLVDPRFREKTTGEQIDHASTRKQLEEYLTGTLSDNFEIVSALPDDDEEDEIWKEKEGAKALEERVKAGLDGIFDEEDAPAFVSITSHSYTLTTAMTVLGYKLLLMQNSSVMPIFVKAS